MWLKTHLAGTSTTRLSNGLRLQSKDTSSDTPREQRAHLSGQVGIRHAGHDAVIVSDVTVVQDDGHAPLHRIAPASLILRDRDGALSFVDVPLSLKSGDVLTAIYDSPTAAHPRRSGRTLLKARGVVTLAGRRSPLKGRQVKLMIPGWHYATPDDRVNVDFETRALRAQLMSPC